MRTDLVCLTFAFVLALFAPRASGPVVVYASSSGTSVAVSASAAQAPESQPSQPSQPSQAPQGPETSPPAANPDQQPPLQRSVTGGRSAPALVWYRNPVWIAIGVLALVLLAVIGLLAQSSRAIMRE